MWTFAPRPSWLLLTLALGWPTMAGAELDISDFGSPKNKERGARSSTRFIVLHTTEGEKKGALAKLRHAGEAHDEGGAPEPRLDGRAPAELNRIAWIEIHR